MTLEEAISFKNQWFDGVHKCTGKEQLPKLDPYSLFSNFVDPYSEYEFGSTQLKIRKRLNFNSELSSILDLPIIFIVF